MCDILIIRGPQDFRDFLNKYGGRQQKKKSLRTPALLAFLLFMNANWRHHNTFSLLLYIIFDSHTGLNWNLFFSAFLSIGLTFDLFLTQFIDLYYYFVIDLLLILIQKKKKYKIHNNFWYKFLFINLSNEFETHCWAVF